MTGYLADAGAWYLGLIRTAKEWGYKPTALIIPEKGHKKSSKWDYLLAYVEARVTSEQCPSCGRPRWICWNEDGDIDFIVSEPICHAVRKKELAEKGKKKDPEPGALVDIEVFTSSRTPLAKFREPWLKDHAKRLGARIEAMPLRPREAPPGEEPPPADEEA